MTSDFGVSEIGQMREQADGVDELNSRLQSAFDAKTENCPEPVLHVLLGQRVGGVAGEAGIVHPIYRRVRFQELGHLQGVVAVPLNPQGEGFNSLQNQESVEGAQRRADVAEQLDAHLDDVGERPKRLHELHIVIARVGLDELGKFPVRPVELSRVHDNPADGVSVAAEKFRHGVNDDVRAPLKRTAQIRCGHGIVNHQRYTRIVRDLGHGLDIEHVILGIAQRLRVNQARLGGDGALEILRVTRIDEGGLNPHFGQRVMEEVIGAAIEAGGRDDLVAGAGDIQNRQSLRRLAGGGDQGRHSTLEGGDALLQHVPGGIHNARIDIAEFLQCKQIGSVRGVLEDKRRGLIDGNGARAGCGVGLLAAVQCKGIKAEFPFQSCLLKEVIRLQPSALSYQLSALSRQLGRVAE